MRKEFLRVERDPTEEHFFSPYSQYMNIKNKMYSSSQVLKLFFQSMKMIQYDLNLRKTRRLRKFKEDKITYNLFVWIIIETVIYSSFNSLVFVPILVTE